jgi:hypothetical protein
MPQFYTLEEAARVLGMSPDELKTKAQMREIRAFMDSGSWRFRVADVDELARRRGLGSDPDISLSDPDLFGATDTGTGDEFPMTDYHLGTSKPEVGSLSGDIGAGTGEQDVLMDDLALPPNPMTGSSSTIIGMEHATKRPTDSDVRIVPGSGSKSGSDSDVRVLGSSDSDVKLKGGPKGRPSDSDVSLKGKVGSGKPSDSDVTLKGKTSSGRLSDSDVTLVSDEISPRPAPIIQSPQVGSSAEVAAVQGESSSDFELSPSDKFLDALEPESGSDFELSALDASSSDDYEAIPPRGPGDSDVTAFEPSASGVNLGKPSDSGINLQAVGGLGLGEIDSIELAPMDSDDDAKQMKPAAKGKPSPGATIAPGMKPSPGATIAPGSKASPGATIAPGMKSPGATIAPGMKAPGQTLAPGNVKSSDITGEKDIFEDTDFEVEAVGPADHDRTMQIDAASDFDLDDSDSASEIFALDEEDVDQSAATAMAPAMIQDEGPSSDEGPTSSEMASAWEEDATPSLASSPSMSMAPQQPYISAPAASAEWGGLWIGLLTAATVFMMLLSFVTMDLVRNMYPRPTSPDGSIEAPHASGLVRTIAGMFGG